MAGQHGEIALAHHHVPTLEDTGTTMDGLGPRVFGISALVGVIGLAAAVGLGLAQGDGLKHFGFSYLVNFAFFLSISLGALIFMPIMYVTKASWNVVIRRLAEVTAAVMPLFAVMAIPVIVFYSQVYGWADPEVASTHAMAHKTSYLSQNAFIIRWVIYFVVWTGYAMFFWRQSVAQDKTGDLKITRRLENFSGFSLMLCGLTIAAAAFDLLMSVDPLWFSTMFGVYYWSGGFVTFFAVLTLFTLFLQGNGRMEKIVSPEHFHDYGKLMFAFTFFWGYIAFSQYMLYWYANIPEETAWYLLRSQGGWGKVGIAIIFVAFIIPFAGLISRFTKRKRKLLAFWAFWIIGAQWLNLYWVVMPEFSSTFVISPMDLALFVGFAGVWLAAITRLAMGNSLVPLKDPRLEESLRFENA
jgi:hypothetical protein